MNLQSDNVGFKSPKYTSSPVRNEIKVEECEEEEEEEDIISRLPDEILTHILSLLPDSDAYRTRILSNRWNHLFFFLPCLCFKMPPPYTYADEFRDFVEKSLEIRCGMPIQRFFLSCTEKYCDVRLLYWLRIVFHSKVETLELRFPDRKQLLFGWEPFTICRNTLVDLTLVGAILLYDEPVERNMCFPCLKKLNLVSIVCSKCQSLENMISACPVLQELCLDEQNLTSDLPTFKISSASLKRLRIAEWNGFHVDEVVIDTPKLEYLYIDSPCHNRYSLMNLSCLVEAYIDIYVETDIQVYSLYTSISSARILTLTKSSLSVLSNNPGLNLPIFPNLIKLIVHLPAWEILFILLNKMPNLQHITIDFGYNLPLVKWEWNPPTEAPACLRFILKEIVILNLDAVVEKDDDTIIRYLQSNSSVLEKFDVK